MIKCEICGAMIEPIIDVDGTRFCPQCGFVIDDDGALVDDEDEVFADDEE